MSENLSNIVAESIKLKIKSGEYKTNEQLPNEQKLSEIMGVSRITVREAIKILASKNIVIIERGKGTFVNSVPGATDDPFGLEFLPTEKVIKDLREIRFYLEPSVARLAARNATKGQIRHMQEIIDKMYEVTESDKEHKEAIKQFSNYEQLFHANLYEMSGNIMLNRLQPVILKSVHNYYYDLNHDYDLNKACNSHVVIFEAIRDHDEETAYKSMLEHMQKP